MISIVSPVYNEAGNLEELCKRIRSVMEAGKEDYEIIFVDNGSTDRSLEVMKELKKKDAKVKFVSLSRNFGHQGGIVAGMANASGDAVISLDADLQHPPELISTLIRKWKNGYSVVFTTKKHKGIGSGLSLFPSRIFYKLISSISDINLSYGESDYRLLDRKVVDVILNIPEKHKFLRGIVKWVGFSQTSVEYDVEQRKTGESKFSFWNYINFAFDGIFSFSTVPLRIFLWLGIMVASFCILWGAYYFVMGAISLFYPEKNLLPPGSATITVSILFLGGVQLIGIGILGEYLGRVYHQTKERPDFIIKEKSLE